ncbi:MAG: DUF6702 family protein [Flavobacteriaceae bacterium]
MKYKKAYILLLVIPLLSFSIHKYYLSLTQIEYNKEEKSVQIIMNVFMDDIELALNKTYNIDLRLTTKKELKDNDKYFSEYLSKKLHLKVNDNPVSFKYLGKEYEGDLVYFYLEIKNINDIKTINVTNQVLMDYFPTQQNLIKSKVNKKHKSLLLTKEDDKGLLKF